MGEINNWATPSMKEFIFWKDDMSPEEFEIEQAYYFGNMRDPSSRKQYIPIWQQRLKDNFKKIFIDETWASPYMKGFDFWRAGMTVDEYKEEYHSYFEKLKEIE